MPNTPALVHNGASVFARGTHTRPDDGDTVYEIFSKFGLCEEMAEKYLDAVTGLSGSGPAYVRLQILNSVGEWKSMCLYDCGYLSNEMNNKPVF